MPYPPVDGQHRWFEEKARRRERDIRHAFSAVKQPCKRFFLRLVGRPIRKLLLYKMMPSFGSLRRWKRIMQQLFEAVRVIDENGDICDADDTETVRDVMRFAIQNCPYAELRVMENVLEPRAYEDRR